MSQSGEPAGSIPAGNETDEAERFPGRRRLVGPDTPDDMTTVDFGTEQTIGNGHRVRILEYEPTLRASVQGVENDLVVDTARVEACAGSSEWSGGALAAAYHLAYPRPSGGFDLRPASSGLAVRKPMLSERLAGETLVAGDCREGWVAFALGTPEDFDNRLPTSIVFDNTAFGFVDPGGSGRASWEIAD